MFKTITLFRLSTPDNGLPVTDLQGFAFTACGPTQAETSGWVPPRGVEHGALIENVGGQHLLRLRTETRKVPGGALRRKLEERAKQVEAETGRKPKGKRLKELKEEITHELMPQAFTNLFDTPIWIDVKQGFVIVGVTGGAADRIATLLVESFAGIRLELVHTESSASAMMAHWLLEGAPAGFTVDRDCKLATPDSEKSAVSYSRHSLERDEITQHLREGKVVQSLALTWNARVSFVLNERMHLRSLKLLDVVLEGKDSKANEDGFDADAAITTGELSKLIPDLIEAMGGLMKNPLEAGPAAVAGDPLPLAA
jgi:recombination associated protein RdgC